MPIKSGTAQVGKCYKTSKNQHRGITKITPGPSSEEDKITYESWGGDIGKGDNPDRVTAKRETFENAVEAEIACPK